MTDQDPTAAPAFEDEPEPAPFKLPDGKGETFRLPTEEEISLAVPNGDYLLKCLGCKKDVGKDSGNPMWVWDFVIFEGEFEGKDFKLYTVLTQDAMWKVLEVCVALGLGGPGDEIDLTDQGVPADVINRLATGRLEQYVYIPEGSSVEQQRSKIGDMFPILGDDGEPIPGGKKAMPGEGPQF